MTTAALPLPAARAAFPTFLADSAQIALRHVRALVRQPWYVAITLVQPIIWLLLFGQLFSRVVDIPGFATGSYVSFLAPGVVVMTALYSSGWSGMGYIIDIERGVMDRMLAAPVRHGAIMLGNLLYGAGVIVIQSLVIIGLGTVAGARFPGGPLAVVMLLVASMLLGAAFASYSNALALLLRSQESVIGVVNLLVLPLSFLSPVFMPQDLLPGWMKHVADFNPVSWAVAVGRESLHSNVDWAVVLGHTALLLALACVVGWLSTRAFRAYRRSM